MNTGDAARDGLHSGRQRQHPPHSSGIPAQKARVSHRRKAEPNRVKMRHQRALNRHSCVAQTRGRLLSVAASATPPESRRSARTNTTKPPNRSEKGRSEQKPALPPSAVSPSNARNPVVVYSSCSHAWAPMVLGPFAETKGPFRAGPKPRANLSPPLSLIPNLIGDPVSLSFFPGIQRGPQTAIYGAIKLTTHLCSMALKGLKFERRSKERGPCQKPTLVLWTYPKTLPCYGKFSRNWPLCQLNFGL